MIKMDNLAFLIRINNYRVASLSKRYQTIKGIIPKSLKHALINKKIYLLPIYRPILILEKLRF